MAITFNIEVDKNRSFYNHGATWSDGGAGAAFDYFDDAAAVDDATYFNMGYYGFPNNVKVGGIRVYVGTPLVADSITTVWEYSTNSTGTVWATFSNVTDGTNSFQNTGDNYVTWDMPTNWNGNYYLNSEPTWKYYTLGYNVRCRITAISNPSEGGANSTNTVKKLNYAVSITDGGSYTLTQVLAADIAGGWGVVTQEANSKNYRINANLYIHDGQLTISEHEQLTIGIESGVAKENFNIEVDSAGILQLGKKDANGYSYSGGSLVWHTGTNRQYPTWYGRWNVYGSSWWMYPAYIEAKGVIDFLDSNLTASGTNTWYFAAGSSGLVKNTTIGGYYIYMYSGLLAFDNVTLVSPESGGAFYGVLAGGGYGKIANTNFKNSLVGNVCQSSFLDLLDCSNFQDDQVVFGGNYTYTMTLQRKFSFNLTVIDNDGNPIEDAVVTLIDQYGRSQLYEDIKQIYSPSTNYLYGLTSPTDTTCTVTNPAPYSVGDIIKCRSELMSIDNITGSNLTVTRNLDGSLANGLLSSENVWLRKESVNTNTDGKLYYDTNKTFEVYAHEYANLSTVTATPVHYAPFTLTISKTGYETYILPEITLTEPVDWTIVLKEQNKTRQDVEGNLYLAIAPETGSSAKILKI